jgi:hypothetical protein
MNQGKYVFAKLVVFLPQRIIELFEIVYSQNIKEPLFNQLLLN